jgi:hypothetical protein
MFCEQKPIMRLENTHQGFFQLGAFGFEAPTRQISQHRRISLPDQQSF